MKKSILTLDLGTQSARAIIFSEDGTILDSQKEVYNPVYIPSQDGKCEQHVDVYINYLITACKKISERNPQLMENIIGVVSTTFRDTAVFLDKNNNVLRPSILWLDQRISPYTPSIPLWKRLAFKIVSMSPIIKANQQKTMAHYIKAEENEIWKKTKKYVNISAYVNYVFTNVLVDTPACAVGHYPIEYRNGQYYEKTNIKYGLFDIPEDMNPKLINVGDIVGYISKEISLKTGIKEGIPFYAGASDKSCEALGNGCIDETFASISYGTASTITITSKKYIEPAPFLPAYPSAQKGYFNSELQIYRGYWMLNWFKDEFCKDETLEATIENVATLDILNKKMLDINPGSDGLILQPYWGPSLERPNSRGAIVGFNEKHTKIHLYRAIIEGICFCLKEGKEKIERKQKKKITSLIVSGGGANSKAVLQITADIFNLPVYKIHTVEASSLGAAIIGFTAANVFATPQEAKEKMVHYVEKYYPNAENAKKYQYLYQKTYTKMFPKLKNIYKNLREYTGEKF